MLYDFKIEQYLVFSKQQHPLLYVVMDVPEHCPERLHAYMSAAW